MARKCAPVGKDTLIPSQTPSRFVNPHPHPTRTVGIALLLVAGILQGCAGQSPVHPAAPVLPRPVPQKPIVSSTPVRHMAPQPADEGSLHVVTEPPPAAPKPQTPRTISRQGENEAEATLLQGEMLLSQGMILEAWQQWAPVAQGSNTMTESLYADNAWRLLFDSYFKQGNRDNTPYFLKEIANIEPTANQHHLLQDLLNRQPRERLNILLQCQPPASTLTPILQRALSSSSMVVRPEGEILPFAMPPTTPIAPIAPVASAIAAAQPMGPGINTAGTVPPSSSAMPGTGLKIGLLLPLSGKWTSMGEHLRRAAKKALADYPAVPIQLQIADSGDSVESSRKAMNDLAAQQVDVVVGPVFYATVQPAIEVASAHHIPIITLNPQRDSDPSIPGVFSNAFQPEQQAKIMARYAVLEKKYGRIAILAPESEYGRGVAKTFSDEVQSLGGKLVRAIYFPPDAADFSPWLKNLGSQFDALFLPASAKQVRLIAPQAAFSQSGNTKVALLGTALWNSPELLSEGTDFLEGAIFCDMDAVAKERFRQSFHQTWEEDPSTLATLAYDGVAVMAQLMQAQQQGGGDWRTALTRTAGFQGANGPVRFLNNGQSRRAYLLFQIENGQIRPLHPVQDSLAIP